MVLREPRVVWFVVALLCLSAGAARAQQSCESESDLLGNLLVVREACTRELFTAEVDALVPTEVTTPGCAEVVRRVARECKTLFKRSPAWFKARKDSLDAAVASAAAALPEWQHIQHIADPARPPIHTCGVLLDDGFDLFPPLATGQSRVGIDVGTHGNVILDFEDISLDENNNDNLRIYSGEMQEVMRLSVHCGPLAPTTCRDLPWIRAHPRVTVPGPRASLLLVSTGGNSSLTSLQVTVGCLCEDGTCEPSPCNGNPCENGGACAPVAAGQSLGGHRRLQASSVSSGGGDGPDGAACPVADVEARAAAVDAACCLTACGAPSTCSDGCRGAVVPFWEDCGARLQVMLSEDPALLEELQNTATQVCAAEYRCTCTAGWTGPNCATSAPSPSPVPATPARGTSEIPMVPCQLSSGMCYDPLGSCYDCSCSFCGSNTGDCCEDHTAEYCGSCSC